jgi:competence protein ComEC
VELLQAYEKGRYTILKVYSPILDLTFFTRSANKKIDGRNNLRLKIYPSFKKGFLDYLGTPFIHSNINKVLPKLVSKKEILEDKVSQQHDSKSISNFYQAIFFATPLDKPLRKQVSSLGVSHLIALSGFHLAILSTLLFFLLRPLYRIFQKRYFPYRFDLYDIGFIVLLILAWYVWFVDAPASLLRSYIMMLVAWALLIIGMDLLSFSFLSIVMLLLLLIFPKLLLSLAFWFSVMGVFYIFLLLQYFSTLNKYLMTLVISFAIFVLMTPIVHVFFPLVTPLQLSSPFLSLLFSFFYPISIFLHFLGFGNLFDDLLLKLFSLESEEQQLLLSWKYAVVYILFSLGSIFSKWVFYALLLGSFLFSVGMFML